MALVCSAQTRVLMAPPSVYSRQLARGLPGVALGLGRWEDRRHRRAGGETGLPGAGRGVVALCAVLSKQQAFAQQSQECGWQATGPEPAWGAGQMAQ